VPTSEFWNARYAEPGYAYGTEPNAFLVSQRGLLKAGMTALAVADGEGRNGVWLAQQGLEVLSVDASEIGLRKAVELAADRGVALRTERVDLTAWTWPVAEFDVVAAIFIHFPPEVRARMHRAMLEALKPGGVLVLEAFTPAQLQYKSGGPPVAEMLYTADMLRRDFEVPGGTRAAGERSAAVAAEFLSLEECVTELAEGQYHRGPAAVVRALLRRSAIS
jgi:2-polyprenyl-3-methyl-5-hydroxy-6-metoxy-1,4-benzoquinol methylase